MKQECKLAEKNKYKQEMRLPIIVAANQLLHATKAKKKKLIKLLNFALYEVFISKPQGMPTTN